MRKRTTLWIAAAGLWAIAGVRIHRTADALEARPAPDDEPVTRMTPDGRRDESRADMVDSLVAGNLFAELQAVEVAEGQLPVEAPAVVVAPRPTLVLRGLAGGPPWAAVVDGIPEHNGPAILTERDSVAGFRLYRVDGDTVVVRGRDTSWVLTLGSPR